MAQARAWAERCVSAKPDFWLGCALLAASTAQLGDLPASHAAVDALKKAHPNARVSTLPYPAFRADVLEKLKSALQKAGLEAE